MYIFLTLNDDGEYDDDESTTNDLFKQLAKDSEMLNKNEVINKESADDNCNTPFFLKKQKILY